MLFFKEYRRADVSPTFPLARRVHSRPARVPGPPRPRHRFSALLPMDWRGSRGPRWAMWWRWRSEDGLGAAAVAGGAGGGAVMTREGKGRGESWLHAADQRDLATANRIYIGFAPPGDHPSLDEGIKPLAHTFSHLPRIPAIPHSSSLICIIALRFCQALIRGNAEKWSVISFSPAYAPTRMQVRDPFRRQIS
jgi:hypothetical protein